MTLSRRAFVAGAAAVGAATLLPTARVRAVGRRRVAVFGGGMSGLVVAHELIERGFSVDVFDAGSVLGGKARSFGVPGSASGGRGELPAEHGFRFFPGFYRNVPDSMQRIPFAATVTASSAIFVMSAGCSTVTDSAVHSAPGRASRWRDFCR